MNKELIEDIIDWDVKNWSKSLNFWSENVDLKNGSFTCLELGGRRGGLSLWLAMHGHSVICSDIASPENIASILHEKYACSEQIEYRSIDATDIPYESKFDIVVFKSIIGGISGNGRDDLKQKTFDEIYKSLKPGGKLLFAENLESSVLHKNLRKRFVNWGSRWNYLKFDEIESMCTSFETVEYRTTGFFGAFGRSEKQRKFLSVIDAVIEPLVPKSQRYIVYGVAKKA